MLLPDCFELRRENARRDGVDAVYAARVLRRDGGDREDPDRPESLVDDEVATDAGGGGRVVDPMLQIRGFERVAIRLFRSFPHIHAPVENACLPFRPIKGAG